MSCSRGEIKNLLSLFTAMLHAASVPGCYWGKTQQCPLLHWLCWYVQFMCLRNKYSAAHYSSFTLTERTTFFVSPPPGEELIYLDPHTTQPAVEPCEDGKVPDETYHCQHPPCRMHICELDPSIAAVQIPAMGFTSEIRVSASP